MKITRFQFDILDSVADGSEPFSMIVLDVFNFNFEAYDNCYNQQFVHKVASEICKMLSLGLVRVLDDEVENKNILLEHYSELAKELNKKLKPFY
ncbi:MAG: hypothetical protein GY774_41520, partial [Planctomycetes bacterium]|nr:hypothetical protein [Planctomycetota bacterium]